MEERPAVTLSLGGPAVEITPFLLADGSGPARQQTSASLQASEEALSIRFCCLDADPWGTFVKRDEPVYQEECVEVFLAPGEDDPRNYYEFELSPLGAFFDAAICNPEGRRETMGADVEWNARGARWQAAIDKENGLWTAEMILPWSDFGFAHALAIPEAWRLNLYRIDRPRDGSPAEYSCWSPTLQTPANFHVPARFGTLRLEHPAHADA